MISPFDGFMFKLLPASLTKWLILSLFVSAAGLACVSMSVDLNSAWLDGFDSDSKYFVDLIANVYLVSFLSSIALLFTKTNPYNVYDLVLSKPRLYKAGLSLLCLFVLSLPWAMGLPMFSTDSAITQFIASSAIGATALGLLLYGLFISTQLYLAVLILGQMKLHQLRV